jgi:hypothetical protein
MLDLSNRQVLAIIDTRRAGPGSPRGRRRTGRSYRDLAGLHGPGSPTSPNSGNVPLPKVDDEVPQRLTMRKGLKSPKAGEAALTDKRQSQEAPNGEDREKNE